MTIEQLKEHIEREWWSYRYRKEDGDIELAYVALRRWTRLSLELWALEPPLSRRQKLRKKYDAAIEAGLPVERCRY